MLKDLKLELAWLTSGNLVYGLGQWAAILAIARLGNPAMVGQFSLAQAIVVPIVVFFGMQLRIVQVTDQREECRFGDYLLTRLLACAGSMVTLALVLWYLRCGAETALVILLVGIARTSEMLSDIYQGLYQQRGAMRAVGISSGVRGILATLALAAVLRATHNLVWSAAALAVGCVAALAFLDLRAPQVLRLSAAQKRLAWTKVGQLSRRTAPLAVAVLLAALNSNLPRYFVHAEGGDRSLGIFSALASVQAAGFLVVNALGQAATPRLARAYDSGDLHSFRKLVLYILGALTLASGVAIGLIFCAGDRVVSVLFGAAYTGQNRTLLALSGAASFVFAASILGAAASAARKLIHQAAVMTVVTGLTALFCYLLTPAWGSFGAALAALASAAIGFTLMAGICWQQLTGTPAAFQQPIGLMESGV